MPRYEASGHAATPVPEGKSFAILNSLRNTNSPVAREDRAANANAQQFFVADLNLMLSFNRFGTGFSRNLVFGGGGGKWHKQC